ncbi:hypothetical protein TNCV_3317191 [Trichonephila clavipes]|nr:hypothetical protein TNCV_3317191 [Trichonephila clavipes]
MWSLQCSMRSPLKEIQQLLQYKISSLTRQIYRNDFESFKWKASETARKYTKRVCFGKDNRKFFLHLNHDAVPENHFHQGSPNYAVSDFADVARIHMRRYKLDETGSLLHTKDGITVTPSV